MTISADGDAFLMAGKGVVIAVVGFAKRVLYDVWFVHHYRPRYGVMSFGWKMPALINLLAACRLSGAMKP